MQELTFAQLDALEAERQAKKVEITERLSRMLSKSFTASELRFIWSYSVPPSSILVQAFEDARTKAR